MIKDTIYQKLPNFFQNALISAFNFIAYRKRYGAKYLYYREIFKNNENLSLKDLQLLQKQKFSHLIQYAIKNSPFYHNKIASIPSVTSLDLIERLPIISKEEIRKNIGDIYTIPKRKGLISKTGGTTGKSLEILFSIDNIKERFAMIENFRSQSGYQLGKKTAWFSGKNLLTSKDLKKNIFWKTDYLYKVRYYSTFHVKKKYLEYYINDLIEYKPEYFVGFPSTIYEIAKYGIDNNIDFPKNIVKAIFPTAETITKSTRELIETYFKTQMYDQYASSEGAPFIFECKNKNMHLELQSGVFEVLDDDDNPSMEGRLVVTSFTTYGTPLIRYDIGDRIELSDTTCTCNNKNPIVKQILGRIDDYIYSSETGKINLGNISNTLKGVNGIVKFQVIQKQLDKIVVKVVVDKEQYSEKHQKQFLKNWVDRVGKSMKIDLEFVDDIPVANSGKFRMVKNHIKHLID